METLLLLLFSIVCIYAVILVSTLAYDLATGRYKRLQGMRSDMTNVLMEIEKRRNRSSKVWESINSD